MSKSSKSKIRMLAMMMLFVSFIARMGVTAYAAGIDINMKGSLLIQPQYNGSNVSGGSFNIYRVATIVDETTLTYELVDPFRASAIDINGIKTASDIRDATGVLMNYISSVSTGDIITASGGQQVTGLDLGIYLVVNTAIGDNYTVASSFLAFLPLVEEDEWLYGYTAFPKLGYTTSGGTPGTPSGPSADYIITPASPSTDVITTVPDNATPEGGISIPQDAPAVDNAETPADSVIPTDEVPLGAAPQTGMLQWPVPVLGTFGFLLTSSGIIFGREKKENEE